MKAIRYHKHGPPEEVLTLDSAPSAPLAEGEVRCAVLAAPINPADLLTIEGRHATLSPLPAVAGAEGVGKVVEVSTGAGDLTIGACVLLPIGTGTFRTEVVVRASNLIRLPEDVNPLQLSMLAVSGLTAVGLLDTGSLREGDWVLQNAGNSVVGEYVVQLAKHRGIRTCNIVRRTSSIERLRTLGADVVVTDGPTTVDDVRAATGSKAHVALDAVGGAATERLAGCVVDGGVVVSYGQLGGEASRVQQTDLIFRGVRLQGLWLGAWAQQAGREAVRQEVTRLAGLVREGKLKARVDATYRLEAFRSAVSRAAQQGREGKVVFTPNNGGRH